MTWNSATNSWTLVGTVLADSPIFIWHHGYLQISLISIWHHGIMLTRDDVIKWKHFPRYWHFVRGIHRSPVKSPHKGQWLAALMFSLICAWTNGWVNNRDATALRRHHAHYDVTVMLCWYQDILYQIPFLSVDAGRPRKLYFSATRSILTQDTPCYFNRYDCVLRIQTKTWKHNVFLAQKSLPLVTKYHICHQSSAKYLEDEDDIIDIIYRKVNSNIYGFPVPRSLT